jgi:hypothetical protein
MRTTLYFTAAALLALGGAALWTMGAVERRAVAGREQLFTFRYDAAQPPAPGADDPWLRWSRRLPWLGGVDAELAAQRAASQYWVRNYDPLAAQTAGGEADDRDPGILLMAAHAVYRTTPLDGDEDATLKRLDGILDLYAEALKRDPTLFDAAYNFEFVARTRSLVALGHRQARQSGRRPTAPPPPPPRTLHGETGAPPAGLEAQEFKVIVPQPSDERQEQREAGRGATRVRKG